MEQDLVDQESTFWNTSCLKGHVPRLNKSLRKGPVGRVRGLPWYMLGPNCTDCHFQNCAHIGKLQFAQKQQTLFLYSLRLNLALP
jgi:hypothetical protein